MSRGSCIWPVIALPVLLFALSGCGPEASLVDERKEANFVDGMDRIRDKDYPGAVRSFEKALRIRPGSSSAHFHLGELHMERTGRPVDALYHFEKAMELNPEHEYADLIRDRIYSLRLKVASSVKVSMDSRLEIELRKLREEKEEMARHLARMEGENRQLRGSLDQMAARQREAARAEAGAAAGEEEAPAAVAAAAPAAPAPAPQAQASGLLGSYAPPSVLGPYRPASDILPEQPVPLRPRQSSASQGVLERDYTTHVVRERDTYFSLGLLYKVSWRKIQRANPEIPPALLQIGKEVRIPLASGSGILN